MQQDFRSELTTQPRDTIKLDGIQKVHELEPEDKYKVLEYLVKEMMGLKDHQQEELRRQREQLEQDRKLLYEALAIAAQGGAAR
jgi:aspartate/methionine/tyrosine aminotransferase